MLAAIIHGIGATPELEDLPSPEPARGTQLVDVVAAGLNPVDLAVAAGSFSCRSASNSQAEADLIRATERQRLRALVEGLRGGYLLR